MSDTQDPRTPREPSEAFLKFAVQLDRDVHRKVQENHALGFDMQEISAVTTEVLDAIREAGGVLAVKTTRDQVPGNKRFFALATASQQKRTFINGGSLEGDWLDDGAPVYVNVLDQS